MQTTLPAVITPAALPLEFGRYILHEMLGEGGLARVFRADVPSVSGCGLPCASSTPPALHDVKR